VLSTLADTTLRRLEPDALLDHTFHVVRKLECDDDEEAFDERLRKIAPKAPAAPSDQSPNE
jgi:hypothetical protein